MALLSVAVVVTATLADAVPLSQTVRWLDPIIYLWTFLSELVTVTVLALLLHMGGVDALVDGLVVGLVVGVGITALQMNINRLYEGSPWSLWLINSGHHAVNLTIAGAILVAWQ